MCSDDPTTLRARITRLTLALLVGALLAVTYTPDAFWQGFWTFCGQVALGELGVMLVLGVPLFLWLQKSNVLKKVFGR